MLDRAAVQRLVPHQGAMCLLDAIAAWDATRIVALALSHRDPHNPLRREGDGALPAICGVEYALQAMAAHGALRAAGRPQPAGYLSSLRGVEIGAERLDDLPGPLLVTAEALATEARGFIYRFAVEGGGRRLLAGQAAIILPEE
ncbi:MAG: hydroxymyristoyl-ACP dehydratase [Acetobacteraceae bacterium]|nr:hydroxymyristoyl-ACP dehydratase [Acetobacteraceae bacterium]